MNIKKLAYVLFFILIISSCKDGAETQTSLKKPVTSQGRSTVTKTLNLNVYLEGLYIGQGVMRQAFNENSFQYEAGIADQIRVELHDSANYSNLIYSTNGINLSTAGLATLVIPDHLDGEYFITVKHRNSLETTSNFPVSFDPIVINYNFKQSSSAAYGNNLKQMSDGTFAIFGGDVSQDGVIDSGDMTLVSAASDRGAIGYLNEDTNGDGLVNSADMTLIENNLANFIHVVLPQSGPISSYTRKTLFGPQWFNLPSNAVVGDTVGEIPSHYGIFHEANPIFVITSNTENNNFAVTSSGVISLSSMNGLIAGQTYVISLRAYDDEKMIEDLRDVSISVIGHSNIIFIDPSYSGAESGTRTQPFNTWAEAKGAMTAGKHLLQKRGTSASLVSFAMKSATPNVTMGAYGFGSRPVMNFSTTGKAVDFWAQNGITVSDLELNASAASILVYSSDSFDSTVRNTIIHGAEWGLRFFSARNVKVINNEIRYIRDDGIYVSSFSGRASNTMEIGFNYIHHINQKYQGPESTEQIAPGDGMQFNGSCELLNVHHNIIDKSDTGNKFCIILSPTDHSTQASFNYNYCKANNSYFKQFSRPVTGFYFENISVAGGNDNVLNIVGNKFENVNYGIFLRDFKAMNAYSNQFITAHTAIGFEENTGGNVFNNLFTNISSRVLYFRTLNGGLPVKAKNNIYAVSSGVSIYSSTVSKLSESDYNLFSHENSGFISGHTWGSWQATGKELHSMVGTPSFVNQGDGDYHLQASSLGVNDGINLGLLLDIEELPFATPTHIGPYQFIDN